MSGGPEEDGRIIRGSGSILIVDDEELIVEVVRAMFENLGYRVVVADGGRKAIEIAEQMTNKIDLVIFDMVMPKMDGGQTFDRIRASQPTLPVILSSEYAIDGKASEILQRGCDGFIQNPFNLSELSKIVNQILDEAKKNG